MDINGNIEIIIFTGLHEHVELWKMPLALWPVDFGFWGSLFAKTTKMQLQLLRLVWSFTTCSWNFSMTTRNIWTLKCCGEKTRTGDWPQAHGSKRLRWIIFPPLVMLQGIDQEQQKPDFKETFLQKNLFQIIWLPGSLRVLTLLDIIVPIQNS